MAKRQKKTKQPVIFRYERREFENSVGKNIIRVRDLLQLHKNGVVTEDDYVMLHNNYIEFAKELAIGWWNNATFHQNPESKWSIEQRTKKIREFITEAFTSIAMENEEQSEENS